MAILLRLLNDGLLFQVLYPACRKAQCLRQDLLCMLPRPGGPPLDLAGGYPKLDGNAHFPHCSKIGFFDLDDHLMAAFYYLAAGDEEGAREHVLRAGEFAAMLDDFFEGAE